MKSLNKTLFFAAIRALPFGGVLTQDNVTGTEAIIDTFQKTANQDIRHLAYILATAFHETGGGMMPVREGFAKSDAAARKKVAKRSYAVSDPVTGQVYYGRGQVQLTWAENYKKMGAILGVPLYEKPDLALEPETSAMIIVEGMTKGLSTKGDFTGKSLSNYFSDTVNDPEGARRIVNGTDKAKLIASYHTAFLDALTKAQADVVPDPVKVEAAKPDKPNLLTDKTTIGTVTAVAGSGIFSAFSHIDSAWAFGAFALSFVMIALGGFLFATGRLQIRRQAGA